MQSLLVLLPLCSQIHFSVCISFNSSFKATPNIQSLWLQVETDRKTGVYCMVVCYIFTRGLFFRYFKKLFSSFNFDIDTRDLGSVKL